MSTNGVNSMEEADMSASDGEKVVTMMDVLQEQQDFEDDANAVLGASDDKNCTYSKGYVKRQAIYACLTCCPDAKVEPSKRAGVCLACSLNCHENHELVELYTKRNFRCDCGNPKFNNHPCQFTPNKMDLNYENKYNQNFSGVYCVCQRPYPDPESTEEEEMIQCIVCEDWLHEKHLEATVPDNDQYSEMICKDCMEDNDFLHDYSDLVINTVDKEIIVTDPDLDVDFTSIIKKTSDETNKLTKAINGAATLKDEENKENDVNSKDQKVPEEDPVQQIDEEMKPQENDSSILNKSEQLAANPEQNKSEILDNKNEISEQLNEEIQEKGDGEIQEKGDGEIQEKGDCEIQEKGDGEIQEKEDGGILEKEDGGIQEKGDSETFEKIDGDTLEKINDEPQGKVHDETQEKVDDETQEKVNDETQTKMHGEIQEKVNENTENLDSETQEKIDDGNIKKSDDHSSEKVDKQSLENLDAESIEKMQEDKLLQDDDEKKESCETNTNNIETQNVESTVTAKPSNSEPQPETTIEPDSTAKIEVNGSKVEEVPLTVEKDAESTINDVEMTESSNTDVNELSDKGIKKKHRIDDDIIDSAPKKQKYNEKPCVRPRGVKRVYKGATFWPADFRQKLCTCNECISMYKDLAVLFLIDIEDTVTAYEALGKENAEGPSSQYEKGLQALSSLDRVQQINALTEYNKMRDKLLDFLKSFKDRKEIVKEEDIKAFFAGMKPKREPDGVYFCR